MGLGGFLFGCLLYFIVRYCLGGFFTIGPNERAVKTSFGRAERIGNLTTLDLPIASELNDEEKERYVYPQLRVIGPGLHFK